jgi:GH35 family endo-1,4-beta-xylanase
MPPLRIVLVLIAILTSTAMADTHPLGIAILDGRGLPGNSDAFTSEMVDVKGQPFPRALRLTTLKPPQYDWAQQLIVPTVEPVTKGDVLLATFYARAERGQAETGEARTALIFERSGEDYEKSIEQGIGVGPEWRRIDLPFVARASYGPGAAQLCLRLGYGPQAIDVGGLTVTNYGSTRQLADLPRTSFWYEGHEADAAWRQPALDRIERLRKADLTVTVTDAAGQPVPGATVRVRQQRHAFGFGTAMVMGRLVDTATDPDSVRYREVVDRYFNKAVTENDLKWFAWADPAKRQTTLAGLRWLKDRGFSVRGHVLVWPGWSNLPKEYKGLPADELRRRIDAHVVDEVNGTRGLVDEFDVVNESYSNRDVLDILGRDEMVRWFKLARDANPDIKLFYNDYTMLSGGARNEAGIAHYFDTARFLLDRGAEVDGFGEQAHMGGAPTPPQRVLDLLDRFAELGRPQQITEFDVNTTDEQVQAAYVRDFYTAAFSHPNVEAILMWGFWARQHWLPDAALWRADWSIKPGGQAYVDLVTKTWWTDATLTTDANGVATVRAFLGQHEVTVGDDIQPVSLTRDGAAITARLGAP